ncbi:transposable element Tcb2 transposase [Trichonephila clavipes]|uniref:Transposable element Tcb2 transposase n=1 Tax=Trichonephila clavipes TaxID=2585209 RepID=A0A8X6VRS5_TRICX|nr:transposable element Tcb2 transposase [Trichonephila clavipes]
MQRLPEAVFQQDNAWPHTAWVSQDSPFTVTTFSWLVRFPDLSPIEHILDHLGRRVGHSTSLNELETSSVMSLSSYCLSCHLFSTVSDPGLRNASWQESRCTSDVGRRLEDHTGDNTIWLGFILI